nr:Arm DNA-binding domain-containing protein [Pseudomonas sp. Q1-7]
MLTDTALRNLKPKAKPYKASDHDGMYVTVSPGGTVTFRCDYRLNGRRETLTIGRYGPAGISLAMAREKLLDAKRMVAQGISPSLEKQRAKRRLTAAKSFGDMLKSWLADARMADSTRSMRSYQHPLAWQRSLGLRGKADYNHSMSSFRLTSSLSSSIIRRHTGER